jgi:hypothetical protein
MTTEPTTTLAERIEHCYRNEDWTPMADIYKPDVLLDVHVPQWRFQLQGADAAIGWFTDTTDNMSGFRVAWTRLTATDQAIVLEWEVHAGSDDDDHLCRQIDLFHLDGGRVAEHVIFCTGMWDPATIARQRSEEPMVRW